MIREWVDDTGYRATMTCGSVPFSNCEVEVNATADLLWAYKNDKIADSLRETARSILIEQGKIGD